MTFPLNTAMFDFLVLSIIEKGDSYGYEISQVIKQVSDTKDSALYPVLKRLQEQAFVETYDRQFQGRNRKYYQITEKGRKHQKALLQEWADYTEKIEQIVKGGIRDE